MYKHISNEIITCNDKDAPWITPQVKTSIKRSTRVYRKWVKRGKNPGKYKNVREVQNISGKLINQAKKIYYHNLGDKLSVVNTKKSCQLSKMTYIYICFLQKANISNESLATKCTINDNGSVLPAYIP